MTTEEEGFDRVSVADSKSALRGAPSGAEPSAPAPAWQRINALFAKHGLSPPPSRLRDELVCHLVIHDRHGGYRP